MPTKAYFYHAGCPVCVDAEHKLAYALDRNQYALEIVHLGQDRSRIAEAAAKGVQSVPALVLDDSALHINFGAALTAL